MKRRLLTWALLAVFIAALVVGAYVLGTLNPAVHVSTGLAYSNGGNQAVASNVLVAEATVTADGWSYGMEGAVSNWQDAAGGWHSDGWPDCLSPLGEHQVRFGWVSVSTPDGLGGREVVWVSCRL